MCESLYLSVCECWSEGKGVKGIFGISENGAGPRGLCLFSFLFFDNVDCVFLRVKNCHWVKK